MLIAQQKRKENIAEYIIYMWQVEDTIRACSFDMNKIEERILSQYDHPESVMDEIRNWYSDIILMMHENNIKKSGHLKFVSAVVDELNDLHNNLLHRKKDSKYTQTYAWAQPNIEAFTLKLKNKPDNEIDTCFQALYALLLMRLQKREISEDTIQAMQTFSNLLSLLAGHFKNIEEGKEEV